MSENINGTKSNDLIITSSGDDTINGGRGNDLIISGAGDDTVNGGKGNDIIISGYGDDTVNGGKGCDILITGYGDDTVNGGSGHDILITGSGDDTANGGSGNDIIITGSGDDIASGGSGHDLIITGSGDDTASGGSGNDVISTGSGNDTATGDSGNDFIVTGTGNDYAEGNAGHDIIITGSGDDTVYGNGGHDIIVSGEGDDFVDAGDGADVVVAGAGNDTVHGGNGRDLLLGESGQDTIYGDAGNDYVHGGTGNDILSGGTGEDVIDGGADFDIASFAGNKSAYTINVIATDHFEVINNSTGETDSVYNVEMLRFDDGDFDPNNPGTGNTDPVAVDDAVSVDEDSSVTIDVLANDTDADGDSLTISSATATNGAVTIVAGELVYTPATNFNGSDTITYTIDDGNGGTATASVTVTVNPVNDGPVAVNDTLTVDEDTSGNIDVLANDTDLDGDTLSVDSATATNGTVTIEADGTLTYTPNANFNGTDTITYTITDGTATATAEVAVTVNAVNDGPVAVNDTLTVDEDSSGNIDVLANDSDLDGDTLSVDSATATNGTVTIEADGTLTYTPDANFNGTDTITYTITDGTATATAEVAVTVNAVNDGPLAVNDSLTIDEDTAGNIDVLANDTDLDGDTLSIDSATATNGTVTIEADGTLTYTPDANFNGTDTITYTITDGTATATAEVAVTVNAVNDGPVAVNDALTVDEDSSGNIDVLANDSDLDGDTLIVDSASATNGTVTIEADGTLTYSPNANFNGTDTITYTITDGTATATAEVAVTVNSVNDGPVAVNDTLTVDEDSSGNIDVLANDSDLDGDTLSVDSASATNGTVTIEADGTLTYTPNANFNGTDTITYTITDGTATATAEVAVTVNAVNDGPVAVNDSLTIDEDTAGNIDVLANDSDLDGDTLSIDSASAANGTVTIEADGTLTYTPDANFNGTDTITYTITDGTATATAEVAVTVNAVNDGPLAVNDSLTIDEDTAGNIDVLANDTDLDGDTLSIDSATATNGTVTIEADGTLTYTPDANFNGTDTITYTITDGTATATAEVAVTVNAVNDGPVAVNDSLTIDEDTAGNIDVLANDSDLDGDTLSVDSATATNGTVTIETDGTLTYVPNANFNGTDTITYTITDGTATATAEVAVTVNAVNDGPVAVNDTLTVDEDTAGNIDVLANDTDLDGDTLSVDSATATNGTVTIEADGTLTYTPDANFNGTDSITYSITDGSATATAEVAVTVNAVNDGPVAVNDTLTVDEDTAGNIDVLANDTDLDGDTLSVDSATATNGTVTIEADGTLTYTPNANFNGTDTITYTITDGTATATAEVAVTVNSVNDGPVAVNDTLTVDEDSSGNIDVLANDSDLDGDTLSVDSATATNGTVTIEADGTLTYTPNANFNGTDTITYTITDGTATATAEVAVTVNSVNDGPVAVNDTLTVDEDSSGNIDVLANDSDLDGDTLSVDSASATNGTVTIEADGTLTYTPNANFNGTDTITYTITDGTATATAEVAVTVNAVNDSPVAVNDTLTVDEDASGNIDVLANDTDLDGDILSVDSATATNGTVTIEADGTLTYTPDANFNGTDTIMYTITDGTATATAEVTVTVNAVNDGPVANDDTITIDEDNSANIDVLANDTDLDGDSLSVTEASADNGTVVIETDGTITYTPDADYNGTDTISYTVSDGNGGTDTAIVTVTINPVDDAPTSMTVTEDDGLTLIDTLLNEPEESITEVNGNPGLVGVSVAGAAGGLWVINADGTAQFDTNGDFETLGAGQSVTESISFTVDDGAGGTTLETFTTTITGVNDAPIVAGEVYEVEPGGEVLAIDVFGFDNTLTANDSDIEGDELNIVAVNGQPITDTALTVTGSNGGTFTVFESGSARFVADGFEGLLPGEQVTTEISYTVSDGNGGTSVATFTVNVNAGEIIANDDFSSTSQNSSTSLNLFDNDLSNSGSLSISQVDGDAANVGSSIAGNNGGLFTINSDGTASFEPNAEFNGLASGESIITEISYTVVDSAGNEAEASYRVEVTNLTGLGTVNDDGTIYEDAGSVGLGDILADPAASIVEVDGATINVNQTIVGSNGGLWTINSDGLAVFDTNDDFNVLSEGELSVQSIEYVVDDGSGNLSTHTLEVTLKGVNDAPIVADDSYETEAGVLLQDSIIFGDGLISDDVDPENPVPFNPFSTNMSIVAVNDVMFSGGIVAAGSNGGSFSISSLGALNFTSDDIDYLAPGESIVTSVTYKVSDGEGGIASGVVEVTVNAKPIVATDDTLVTDELNSVSTNLIDNDISSQAPASISEVDGQNLSGGSLTVSGSNGGEFVVNADGSVTFNPGTSFDALNEGETATTSIEYTLDDGLGNTDTAQLTVTVNGVTAAVSNFSINEDDGALNLGDLGLPPGSTVTAINGQASDVNQTIAGTNGGQWTVQSDGTVFFNTNGDFNSLSIGDTAIEQISVIISDAEGSLSQAIVEVTVNGENDAPVAVTDTATVEPGQNVNLLLFLGSGITSNDTDIDGDNLTVIEVDGQAFTTETTVTGSNGGTFRIQSAGNAFFQSGTDFDDLAPGESRTTSVSYTISDGNGGTSTTTFEVNVVADSIGAGADTITTDENTTVSLNVFDNDASLNGTINLISVEGSSANVGQAVSGSNGGQFVISSDGTASFDPLGDFSFLNDGESLTTSIDYVISDGAGSFATGTLTVTVNGISAQVSSFSVGEDDGNVALGDVVIDAASAVTSVSGLAANVGSGVSGQTGGVWTINSDGSVNFDTNGDFDFLASGETLVETIDFVVDGTDPYTVEVTITGSNDAAIAVDDVFDIEVGDTVRALNIFGNNNGLTGNDIDPEGDALTVIEVDGQPIVQGQAYSGQFGGEFFLNSVGSLVFTASGYDALLPGESVQEVISYTVQDSSGATSTANIIVNVTANMTAGDDTIITDEDTAGSTNVLTNDASADGPLTVTQVDGGSANVGVTVSGSNGGLFTINADGTATFDPNGEFESLNDGESASSSITYEVTDNLGQTETATLTATVNGIFDDFLPDAVDDSAAVEEDSGATSLTNVLDNDDQGNGPASVSSVAGLSTNVGIAVAGSAGGLFTISANGDVSFDTNGEFENLNAGDSEVTTITYTIEDSDGDTSTATYEVTVSGANELVTGPTLNEDDGLVSLGDLFADAPAFVAAVDGSTANVGANFTAPGGRGIWNIDANGNVSFDTNGDFEFLNPGDQVTESITVSVDDGSGNITIFNYDITVQGQNNAPIAVGETYSVNEGDEFFAINYESDTFSADNRLIINDSDPDPTDTVSISAVNGQAISGSEITVEGSNGGTFTIFTDGTMRFDATSDFEYLQAGEVTTSTATYTVTDPQGATADAVVTIEITGSNDDPDAGDDTGVTVNDDPITINLLANDSDVDGGSLSITGLDLSGLEAGASVVDNGDGTITYQANGAFAGLASDDLAEDTFTYTVSDGQGGLDVATVQIIVAGSASAASDANTAIANGEDPFLDQAGDDDFGGL